MVRRGVDLKGINLVSREPLTLVWEINDKFPFACIMTNLFSFVIVFYFNHNLFCDY